ncbi:hypothetical protein GGR89_002086 [Sphingomonas trueperi]|uniref:Uncharacterized protein n=1 Tax=Sphingomonas trueperi TaxID=53317 RepID=A0A7X6BDC9_9SPHN|nr:hypothetical protein [Sphingomonas trueperi]
MDPGFRRDDEGMGRPYRLASVPQNSALKPKVKVRPLVV